MHKAFLFSNTAEAAPYMDEKILRYIDERITDSLECFTDSCLLSFDWCDVQGQLAKNYKMLLYFDNEDLLAFCEAPEAEEMANMLLHSITGEEDMTNEQVFYHFFTLLLKGDMDFLNSLEEEITRNEELLLSGR